MRHANIFPNILKYLWSNNSAKLKIFVLIAFFAMILSKGASVTVPIIFKYIIDGITQNNLSLPLLILITYGSARITMQLFNELKEILFAEVEQESVRKLALSVFRHLHSLSLRFHLDRKTGSITRSMERGAKALEMAIRFSMFNIVPTIFEIIIVSITLYALYPAKYMAITLMTLICYGSYTLYITEWRTNQIRKMKEAENQSSFKAIESLINYETVKYFTNENYEAEKYDKLLQWYKKITIKNRRSLSILNIGQAFIISCGLVLIMIFAYHQVQTGTMTSGDFVLINMYLMQLYQPLSNLGFSYREIKLALIDMEHMFALLNEKQEITDKKNAKTLKLTEAELAFSHVNFHYSPERKILSDISFEISSGKTLAIVGPSGSGKSTITRLIFRFYEAIAGEILINGNNIDNFTQESLRKTIGIVPQDTVLFNDTISYNISYGNKSATSKEIEEAAKIAEIHDFIISLPKDYETIVGERGLKLSGGEKQRIAIARTILKKPQIFIFDEATSALDSRTEYEIQKSIDKISQGKTTIMIAHRLSTIVRADEIIVLKAGKIAEKGKHKELLQKEGCLYKRMWDRQKTNARNVI
ncbi:MAG: ABC transporter ATP-binding protein/permease [Rickettsiaceae bacterium H1]|nr:ABC transporter ATP-binding protein/permease [Rickettsiaceae bacterium H1]